MIDARSEYDRLQPLLAAMLDDQLTDEQAAELRGLLTADPAARRRYVRQVATHGMLQWALGEQTTARDSRDVFPAAFDSTGVIQSNAISDFQPLSPLPSSLSSPFVGGPVFSYIVASVVLCAMLLSAWAYKITHHDIQTAGNPTHSAAPSGHTVFVARITGMADCEWTNPEDRSYAGSFIPVGKLYELASGLLEITYKSGARVILEGPCSYTVDSDAGGYLLRGKLVARIDNNLVRNQVSLERITSHKRRTAVGASARNGERHLITLYATRKSINGDRNKCASQLRIFRVPDPVFKVRTPTAVVTDLGTEFGVKVDENGATTSHVFQGIVEVKRLGGENAVRLTKNQSAHVEPCEDKIVLLSREKARSESYARNMRPRATINAFNTGRGLSGGQYDPHWTLIADGDAPSRHERQAVVLADVPQSFARGNPGKSQWISGKQLERDAECTFRTHFDLVGVSPLSTVMWGRIMANGRITAIRLNGHAVSAPDYGNTNLNSSFGDFTASKGFVNGRNVLEIDVSPVDPLVGPMLRVELEGKSKVFNPKYEFVDLSLQRRDCKVTCINDNGLVSGYMKVGYRKIPLIYNSESSDPHAVLISLPRNANASVRACNDAGQLVGCTFDGNDESVAAACVLSEKTGLIRLPGSEAYKISEAWAINNAGIIVGEFTTYEDTVHSFVNSGDSRMTNIGGLGGKVSRARDINDAGWIVGFSTLPGDGKEHSYLYDGKEMIDLGTGEGVTSRALGLNNTGTVAGYFSNSSNDDHAHAYRCDGRAEQPALHRIESLGAYSIACDINDSGVAVGQYWDGDKSLDNFRAFIYINDQMYDLNQLVSLPRGHTLRLARGINNSGMIAAWGTTWGGREFACLLTPVEDAAPSKP